MSGTIEIKLEAIGRLVQECSDAWYMYYECSELDAAECDFADVQLAQALTYQHILEYITEREWYYDSRKEHVVLAD